MKRYIVLLSIGIALPLYPCAVTYKKNGRRLGDNLLAFCNALWVSYKKGIPLLYRPFKNADKFELSLLHENFHKEHEFADVIAFKEKGKRYDLSHMEITGRTLYMVPYFPFNRASIVRKKYFHFDIDWKDPGFVALMRRNIKSIESIEPLRFPEGRIAVAVHVRTGRGHDKTYQIRKDEPLEEIIDDNVEQKKVRYVDKRLPHKFPPNSFFIENIRKMSELLDDQPLYVHIFTDDPEPDYFCQLFKDSVGKPNIEYGFRKKPSLLEDFFALTQFSYFIRGESNFSVVAQLLADAKITIVPVSFRWEGRKLIVTRSKTIYGAQETSA